MTLDALTAARIGADAVYYEVSKRQMVAGEGVYLIDEDGRSYIDCASATFNLSLGYGHPAVIAAMRAQADRLVHVTSGFQTEVINELCAMLVELAPAGMARAHLKVASGSGANEGAIKMAQRATGARDVITLFRSHHGQTALTASISGNAFRREALVDSYPNLIVPDPYCRRCFYGKSSPDGCGFVCVDRIDQFIEFASRGDVAAIMVEPISGNGGNIVPPPGYFATLQEFCAARGIKIIMDEIQTGIGRTGYMFASEYFGITPDAITVAKGLGGSGAQVAGIITTEEMAGLPINEHSFTYGSNLMAAAAGVATLRTVSRCRSHDESPPAPRRSAVLDCRLLSWCHGRKVANRPDSPVPQNATLGLSLPSPHGGRRGRKKPPLTSVAPVRDGQLAPLEHARLPANECGLHPVGTRDDGRARPCPRRACA